MSAQRSAGVYQPRSRRGQIADAIASFRDWLRELVTETLRRALGLALVVVGIASQDIESDARRFAQQEHARWTLAFDGDNAVSAAYGVRALPQTFFIRRDGTIASRLFGLTSQRELEGDLRGILG